MYAGVPHTRKQMILIPFATHDRRHNRIHVPFKISYKKTNHTHTHTHKTTPTRTTGRQAKIKIVEMHQQVLTIWFASNEYDNTRIEVDSLDMSIREFLLTTISLSGMESTTTHGKIYKYNKEHGADILDEKACAPTNKLSDYIAQPDEPQPAAEDTITTISIGTKCEPFFYIEWREHYKGQQQQQQQLQPQHLVTPQQQPLDDVVRFMPTLMAMASANLDAWDRTSEQRTKIESDTVRQSVMDYYGIRSKQYCQILKARTKNVVNAHIWPKGSKSNLVLLGLNPADIDDPQNVLRLHKDLERCYDHKQVTFVESPVDSRGWVLKVLDPTILDETLEGTDMTMKEVNGGTLRFHNTARPWRQVLALHSIMAHRHARTEGWLNNDDDLCEAEVNAHELVHHSLDTEAQDRLRLFLRQ